LLALFTVWNSNAGIREKHSKLRRKRSNIAEKHYKNWNKTKSATVVCNSPCTAFLLRISIFYLEKNSWFSLISLRILNYCNFLWKDRRLKILTLSPLKRAWKEVNFMSQQNKGVQDYVDYNEGSQTPREMFIKKYRLQFLVILAPSTSNSGQPRQ
jgi:hypothetical protein